MTLKQTAIDVLDLLDRGAYRIDGHTVSIEPAHTASVQGARLYTPEALQQLRDAAGPGSPAIEVVVGTTQQWAQQLGDDAVLLNFASARNPGGGFLNGAKAQEEDLCRCSGLYPSLLRHMTYYEVNQRQRSLLYTDHAIYTPRVVFFRTRGTGELLREPFLSSVITAPAPNSGPHLRAHPDDHATVQATFERRWRNVLAIARDQGHPTVLLGAWGCGAFGGDPEVAASTARRAIEACSGGLQRIVFAIPDRGRQSKHNLDVFRRVLAG